MHCSTDALLAPGCNPKKKSGPRCLSQLPLVCQQFHSIISKEHVKKGLDLAATSPGSKQHCTWTVSQNMLKPLLISTAHGWILVPTQLHLLTMGLWPQWNLHPTKWHSAPQNTFKFGIAILTSWGLYYGGWFCFKAATIERSLQNRYSTRTSLSPAASEATCKGRAFISPICHVQGSRQN